MGTFVCNAEKAEETVQQDIPVAEVVTVEVGDYEKYIKNNDIKSADESVSIPFDGFTSIDTNATLTDGVIDWSDGKGRITFNTTMLSSATYEMQIVWKPKNSGIDPKLGVMIDGNYPFTEASQIELKREWKNISETPRIDGSGNEYAQEQVETGEYITTIMQDYSGAVTDPYTFKLTEGVHTITLVNPEQSILIKEI